jgi:hypothetical protein
MSEKEKNELDPFDEDDFFADVDDEDVDDAAEDSDDAEGAEDGTDAESGAEGNEADTDDGGEDGGQPAGEEQKDAPDANALKADGDVADINKAFPGLGIKTLAGLKNLRRYGELREMGISPVEAFCATNAEMLQKSAEQIGAGKATGKAHLQSVAKKTGARAASQMTNAERRAAREMFDEMSDADLEKLYARATRK